MIWTKDEVLNRPKYICACSTVEQADEIITALEMHAPMNEACRLAVVELDLAADRLCELDMQAAENAAQRAMEVRAALTYPTKKETTP